MPSCGPVLLTHNASTVRYDMPVVILRHDGLMTWTHFRMELNLIAMIMGPTWGPSGTDRTQVGPMLAPWTLLSGKVPTGTALTKLSECNDVAWTSWHLTSPVTPPFVQKLVQANNKNNIKPSIVALCEKSTHGFHIKGPVMQKAFPCH